MSILPNVKFYHDTPYLNLVYDVLTDGVQKGDRTGTGTISTFGKQMSFNLSGGTIPLLTTKKMHTRSIIHEIIWYLQGSTNIKYLNDNNVTIWDEWADEHGELGPVYGYQWRKWPRYPTDENPTPEPVDQIADVIYKLRNNPNDRRIIFTAWNVAQLDQMALPPCHAFTQFYSRELTHQERVSIYVNEVDTTSQIPAETLDNAGIPLRALSCQLYQRSCDVGLGVPFNIVQYSIFTHMIAQVTNHYAEKFVWTGGDVHVYNNHIDQLNIQLDRNPYPSPTLKLDPSIREIDDFRFEHFSIEDYNSYPSIKMEVSV